MHNLSESGAESSLVNEVIGDVVRACMVDIDEIVETYLVGLAEVEGYGASAVPREDLRDTAVASMELLLRLIGNLPLTDRLLNLSEELGHRRARQGVALESLLQAVRLDFRLLWSAMLPRVLAEQLPAFTRGAIAVWEAVEFHTIRVHAGYLAELASLAHEREQQQAILLGRLLSSDGTDASLIAQTARALGVEPASPFLVAVAAKNAHKEFHRAVSLNRAKKSLHERDGALVLLLEQQPHLVGVVPDWLAELPGAVAPVAASLADVPRMVRIAEDLIEARRVDANGMATVRRDWGGVAARRLGEFGDVLADSVLSGLNGISAHERARLIETVNVYFASGSVTATVRELFCHRNTVLNRLNRFTALTEFDPTRPVHAAAIMTALHHEALSSTR